MSDRKRGAWIEIDGVRQTNVRAITVHSEVNVATSVTLELVNVEVEIEAEDAHVAKIVDATHLESENREYRAVE